MRWGKSWRWSPVSGEKIIALLRIQQVRITFSNGWPGEVGFIGSAAAHGQLSTKACIGEHANERFVEFVLITRSHQNDTGVRDGRRGF